MQSENRKRYYAVPYGLFALGLALIVIGIFNLTPFGSFGSQWMIIPGVIFLGSGISILAVRLQSRKSVLTALKNYNRVSLSQLSEELNMEIDDVREAIIDLRNDGEINTRLDTSTNEVIVNY
jgi:hypothetical protein